jgi:hypothetical protein
MAVKWDIKYWMQCDMTPYNLITRYYVLTFRKKLPCRNPVSILRILFSEPLKLLFLKK